MKKKSKKPSSNLILQQSKHELLNYVCTAIISSAIILVTVDAWAGVVLFLIGAVLAFMRAFIKADDIEKSKNG